MMSVVERVDAIRAEIRARRVRDHVFAGAELSDPRWEMLQDMEAVALEGYARPVSVSSLCLASQVPSTTALRALTCMTEAGWLRQVQAPTNQRRRYVMLSDRAVEAFGRYREAVGYAASPRVIVDRHLLLEEEQLRRKVDQIRVILA